MRIDRMRQSTNVEDRRGMGGGGFSFGGPRTMVGGGLGGVVILVLILLLGGNPMQLFQGGGPATPTQSPTSPQGRAAREFVGAVLGDTEDVWTEQFRRLGKEYIPPKLVLFEGAVRSACGNASAAVGPFYCPADRTIYIDLSFFGELSRRFGAPGDFAQAYVIAHEVGHHVQTLLGTSQKVDAARGRVSEREFNELSVRLELQADFLAGVWAHHAQASRQILEAGDIEEGLRAAAAIGDDTLQKKSQGYVVPDAFTHGTSAQRVKWFRKGLETGDIRHGDTFGVPEP